METRKNTTSLNKLHCEEVKMLVTPPQNKPLFLQQHAHFNDKKTFTVISIKCVVKEEKTKHIL